MSRILPRLAHLQRHTPRDRELFYDLAYTLAYLGVDYRRNVHRLTLLDELWDKGDPRWQRYVSEGADMRDEIPSLVGALYRHNHDPALLRTLFSWRLDGGPAEILDTERAQLCANYPAAVLRVIRGSSALEEGALSSLGDGVGADDSEYRRAVTRIRRACRNADPRLQSYTRRFLRRLAARRKLSQ